MQAGGWAFSQMWLEETRESVVERLRARAEAEPLEPGLAVAELLPPEPWAPAVLPLLPIERRGGMAYLPGVAASLGARAAAAEELGHELEEAGLAAVKVDDPELARYLEGGWTARAARRRVRRSSAAYERARELVVAECTAAGEIALARFRDLAGVGRRDAQLLLERLDQDGVTRRLGDRRVLRGGPHGDNPGTAEARPAYGSVSPLGLVLDANRVRDAVDVVEVADHLDRVVDRSVVPAVRPQHVGVLQPDRGGERPSA